LGKIGKKGESWTREEASFEGQIKSASPPLGSFHTQMAIKLARRAGGRES